MRVALYALSSPSDESCELQLQELRCFVGHCGWTIYKEYVESGAGRGKADRPALSKLMADAVQRCFDVVLVQQMRSFALNVCRLVDQLDFLEGYGIRFMAPSQGLIPIPRIVQAISFSTSRWGRSGATHATTRNGVGPTRTGTGRVCFELIALNTRPSCYKVLHRNAQHRQQPMRPICRRRLRPRSTWARKPH